MQNENVVVLTCNLTHDPDPRAGGEVCGLRVACNGRRKDEHGNWVDKANYFNVTCFGSDAKNALKYLKKGREILVHGRLDWHEYEKDGGKRQSVQIVAERVFYLRGGEPKPASDADPTPSEQPNEQLAGVGAGGEEDIPF